MMILGPIGFGVPWLLAALAAVPVLWWLMRALPPRPRVISFPGTVLLTGLTDPKQTASRTPWWLLAVRMAAFCAAILAFAAPVWRPVTEVDPGSALLIVIDAGATAAPGWQDMQTRASRSANAAISAGKPVAVLMGDAMRSAGPVQFSAGPEVVAGLRAAQPAAWPGGYRDDPDAVLANLPAGQLATLWFSDGLDHPGRSAWLSALQMRGDVRVQLPSNPTQTLRLAGTADAPQLEMFSTAADSAEIIAIGPDPQGIERELARLPSGPPRAAKQIFSRKIELDLRPELAARVSRFQIEGVASAAAVVLGDDRLRRPVVALITDAAAGREGQALLSPFHYLRAALSGQARVIEAGLGDALPASPDVIVLSDATGLEGAGDLAEWVQAGGLLIRFAGPRMAADPALSAEPLLPVRLRPGGRDLGGALSWGEPRAIAPFDADGPFAGLDIPADVAVRAQLMADPGPELAQRSLATLQDGTPLVTRAPMGQGQLVLFHSSADADWSSLPISGLFYAMIARLIDTAGRQANQNPQPDAASWQAQTVLDGFGRSRSGDDLAPVAAEVALKGAAPGVPAGIYASGERRIAVNAGGPIAAPVWTGSQIIGDAPTGIALGGWLLLLATAALLLDLLGTVLLRGGARNRAMTAATILFGLMLLTAPHGANADDPDPQLIRAAREFALGYVVTGIEDLDATSLAGLAGLSQTLTARTTVEPTPPVGVDVETADLSLLSFLYWPIGPDQATPSAQAYLSLNRYLRGGGMILLDTRDADIASADGNADLRRLAGPMDLPPLQPVPDDHVLSRSFYLLEDMPGRFPGEVWVAASTGTQTGGGKVNDGVSPVVLGGNAWAEAWAIDGRGLASHAVGVGLQGERQRELAHRFGINLIMYTLTGNYKADQIHIPALLERLARDTAP